MASADGIPEVEKGPWQWARVTTVISPTIFQAQRLAQYPDSYFVGWSVYVLHDIRSTATVVAPPEGQQQIATAFAQAGGSMTHPAFTVPMLPGDDILMLHPDIGGFGASLALLLARLTAARALLLDNLSIIAPGGAGQLTPARAALLSNLDAAITSRAAPGAAMNLLAATIVAIRQSVCAGGDPGGSIGKLLNDYLNASVLAVKTQTDKIANIELETEWATTPVAEQVAAAAPTNLTAGSVTPTFPTGSTRVRALLIASIHAANQAANTHHVGFKVQGQKAAGGYADQLNLTATKPLALVAVDGSGDGWVGAIDVTTLVNTSAVAYDFRFVVTSDNAGAVNYTTGFSLVLVYKE